MAYLLLIVLLTLLNILVLLLNFTPAKQSMKETLLTLIDMPIYLCKAHRKHLKDIYDYCIQLEHHAMVLATHHDKVLLTDKDLKLKIRKVKEIINASDAISEKSPND